MKLALSGRTASLAAAVAVVLVACTGTGGEPDSSGATLAPGDGASSQAPASAAFEDGVTAVACDLSAQARAEDVVTVLGDPMWRVGGWNHVNGVGSFATVKLDVGDYAVTAENWLPDDTCDGAKTLATVLAKKTYNWDQQHANGMESSFPTEHLTFGEVTDLVLVLRLDPQRSHVPDATELAAAYGDLLTPEQLAQLDGAQVNLELTLFGEGATAEQPFMNAGLIVSVDRAQASDGWVRVQIPREELTFYTEENYERTEVSASDFQELAIQGLRINPETEGGMTVRSFLQGEFDATAKPELFKEMALTFALIEVGRA